MDKELKGAGTSSPSPAPSFHDDEYDMEVYPAKENDYGVDLLVPTHGKIDLTIKCIEYIFYYTLTPFHLMVMDEPTENDYGMTEKWVLEFRKTHANITYCKAKKFKTGNTFFNAGLKYCRTEYVATIMNSMTVEPTWETAAMQIMKDDPLVGTIGFKCLFPNGHIESAGIIFAGHMPTDYGRDEPGYRCNEIREAVAVQWAFALHRVKALKGNLRDDIFNGHVGWDDIDNCFVVKSKGWKILYCGQGVGIHQPRATRGDNSVTAFRKNQQNAHRFYKRWGLWEQYLESGNMNVAETLKPATKELLSQAVSKIQMLQQITKEHEKAIQLLVGDALREIGVDPELYLLEMNPQKDTWVLRNNPKAKTTPVEAVKPAGDTEAKIPEEVKV